MRIKIFQKLIAISIAVIILIGIIMSFSHISINKSNEKEVIANNDEVINNYLVYKADEKATDAVYSDSTFIIKYKEDVSEENRTYLNELYGVEEVERIDGETTVLRIKEGQNVEETIEKYVSDENVEYSEPDYICEFSLIPNDPYYKSYQSTGANLSGIPGAWDYTVGSDDIIVAVIDSGCVNNHEDLEGRIVGWHSAVSGMDPTIDTVKHGTAVVGTVAATGNNGKGVAGVTWKGKVLAIKADDAEGTLLISNVAKGIIYAADYGADVINLSLGTTTHSTTLQNAINYAYAKGCIIVAASGNTGTKQVNYPAAYSNVIGVGNTENGTTRLASSSYGEGLDVMAIGKYHTTYVTGSYATATGTSFASPQVAGLCALLLSIDDTLTQEQVREYIINGCKDLAKVGWDEETGYGFVNFQESIEILLRDLGEPVTIKYVDAENPNIVLNEIDAGIINVGETYTYEVPQEYTYNGIWELLELENRVRNYTVVEGENEILVEYKKKISNITIKYVDKNNKSTVLNELSDEAQAGTTYTYEVPEKYSHGGIWILNDIENLNRTHEIAKGNNEILVEYEKADLTLTKGLAVGQSDTVMPGEKVEYKIVVKNTGDADLHNIKITDELDINWIKEIKVLPSLGTKEYEFSYTIPTTEEEGQLTNTATVECDEITEKTASIDVMIEYKKSEITVIHENTLELNDTYIERLGASKNIDAKIVANMCVKAVKVNDVFVTGLTYPITAYQILKLNEASYQIVFVYATDMDNDKIPDEYQNGSVIAVYENTSQANDIFSGTVGMTMEVLAKEVSGMCVKEVKLNNAPVTGLIYPIESYEVVSIRDAGDTVTFVYVTDANNDGIPDELQQVEVTAIYENTLEPNDKYIQTSGTSKQILAKEVIDMCVKEVKLNSSSITELTYPITSYEIESIRGAGDIVTFVYAYDLNHDGIPDEFQQVAVIVIYENTVETNGTYTATYGLEKKVTAETIADMCVKEVKLNNVSILGLTYPIKSYEIEEVREAGDTVIFVYAADLNRDGIPDELQQVSIVLTHENTGEGDNIYTEIFGGDKLLTAKSILGMCIKEVEVNGEIITGLTYPIKSYKIENLNEALYQVVFLYTEDLNNDGIPDEIQEVPVVVMHENTEIIDEVYSQVFGLSKEVFAKAITGMCVKEVKLNNVTISGLTYPITKYKIPSVREQGDVVRFIYVLDSDNNGIPDEESNKGKITITYQNTSQANETIETTMGTSKTISVKSVFGVCVGEVKLNGISVDKATLTHKITSYVVTSVGTNDIVTFIYEADLNNDSIPDRLQGTTITIKYQNTNEADEVIAATAGLSKQILAKTVEGKHVIRVELNGVTIIGLTAPIFSCIISSVREAGDSIVFVYENDGITVATEPRPGPRVENQNQNQSSNQNQSQNQNQISNQTQSSTTSTKAIVSTPVTVTLVYENTEEPNEKVTTQKGQAIVIIPKNVLDKCVDVIKVDGVEVENLRHVITNYPLRDIEKNTQVVLEYADDVNNNGIPDYKEIKEEEEEKSEGETKSEITSIPLRSEEDKSNNKTDVEITEPEESGISPKTVVIGAAIIIAVLGLSLLAVTKL